MSNAQSKTIDLSNMPMNTKGIMWHDCVGRQCNFEYGDKRGLLTICSYDGIKLGIKYTSDDIFYISPSGFKKCAIGTIIGVYKGTHLYSIGEVVNEKLKIIERVYNKKNEKHYRCECIKCGFNSNMQYYKNGLLMSDWSISEANISLKKSCPCCCNSSQVVVTDINSMYRTDYWMIELGVDEEFAKTHTSKSGLKAPIKCPNCYEEFNKITNSLYRNKSIGCSCSDSISIPEKVMHSILTQLHLNFKRQYSPSWTDKIYDFYISEINCIIETHGEQHYKEWRRKGARNLLDEQSNDILKKEIACQNGILNYIVIDCRKSDLEFIKNNILKSNLTNLCNVSDINWREAGEYAMNNLSKKACDLWNNSKGELGCKEIAEILNVNKNTINVWLKHWVKIGKCDYNPKDEIRKRSSKVGKISGKSLKVYKNGVFQGEFESAMELERKSFETFGVKLSNSAISSCCRNDYLKSNIYKGFTFYYC